MTDWLLVTTLGLTTFRLTRLVTTDDFPPVRFARLWITTWSNRSSRREWVGDLVGCHWCASGWIAIALVLLVLLAPSFARWFLFFGAAWAIGALVADYDAGRSPS